MRGSPGWKGGPPRPLPRSLSGQVSHETSAIGELAGLPLSWTSPLAEVLMSARVGDVVEFGDGRPAVAVASSERG
jgi:hypothetical protein